MPVQAFQAQTPRKAIDTAEAGPGTYFSAEQFEKCIIELCYDNILRFRGEYPKKEVRRNTSNHLFTDLDTFISKSMNSNLPKSPSTSIINQDQETIEASPKRDNGYFISRQASISKSQRHTQGNERQSMRPRSLKRTLSQKKSEPKNAILLDDPRSASSLEILLEVLVVIVSKAPEHWVSCRMIEIFKQSREEPVQDLLEKLHSKTSQYIMFLVLKISVAWIETSVKFRSRMMSESNCGHSRLPLQSIDPFCVDSIRNDSRSKVVAELASYVFLRPQRADTRTLNQKDKNFHHEADAREAFEILLLAYEKINQQKTKSMSDGLPQNSLKRKSTLTISTAPSLSLPPWRKVSPTARTSKQNRRSVTSKTYLRTNGQYSRNQLRTGFGTLSSEISLPSTSVPVVNSKVLISRDVNLTDPLIPACKPHPMSAILNPSIHELIKKPEEIDNSSTLPYSENLLQVSPTEDIIDIQLNSEQSELLGRAAAAAHSYRSSYSQCRSTRQSQRYSQKSLSQSRVNSAFVSDTRDTPSLNSTCKDMGSNSGHLSQLTAESMETESEKILISFSPTESIQFYEPEGSESSKGLPLQTLHDYHIEGQDKRISPMGHTLSPAPKKPPMPKIPVRVQSISHARKLHISNPGILSAADTKILDCSSHPMSPTKVIQSQEFKKSHETPRQESSSVDIRDVPVSATGRHFWARPILLLKRRSSNKTDSSAGPLSGSPSPSCYSPPGVSQNFKYPGSPLPVLISETDEFLLGNHRESTAAISRRRILSKSQDYSCDRSGNRIAISPEKSSRHTNSTNPILSSTKAKSMPIPSMTLPSPRSVTRDTVVKSAIASESYPNKLSPGWPTLNWRNPFQPLSPTRSSSDFTEFPKQRGNLEEPPSPSLTLGPLQSIRRKKSIQEKLFGKWSKRRQLSPLMPLASPGPLANGASDCVSSNRSSFTSLSGYGSSAASPTFQRDGGVIIKKCEQKFNNDRNKSHGVYDSDEDDGSLSPYFKKRDRNLRSHEGSYKQDEPWGHSQVAVEYSDYSGRESQAEDPFMTQMASLWTDDEDEGGRRNEDRGNNYIDCDDNEYEYECKIGEYERSAAGQVKSDSKSDANIWRVLDSWKDWSHAHSARN
ncbi:hypothetical protein BGZ76_004892 [Entomortierella beljakovae]|nr:hypothetical protein BGZ76_004892 [Entomortierella beljakovae]